MFQDPEEVMKMDEETVKKIQDARSIFQLKKHATDEVTDFVCIKNCKKVIILRN